MGRVVQYYAVLKKERGRGGLHTHGHTLKERQAGGLVGTHRDTKNRNAGRVRAYRSYHNLPALDRTDDKPSEMVTLNDAATILGVYAMTVRRLIGRGILPASQAAPSVPWSIRRRDLDEPRVKQAVQASKDYPSLTARRDTKTLRFPGM